jgi:hypothetical protein
MSIATVRKIETEIVLEPGIFRWPGRSTHSPCQREQHHRQQQGYLRENVGAEADLGKRYNQAFDVPSGYPQPARVSAEDFRRGAIVAGEAAYSPAYAPPARPVPVPPGTLNAAAITRPLMTGGQSRPSAEGDGG